MRFYTLQHRYSAAIDLHTKWMYVCQFSTREGQHVCPQEFRASPKPSLRIVAPYRDDLVVAVECMFALVLARRFSACARPSPLYWVTPST